MNYTSREVYEFISKQTKDPIVQWKTCAISGAEFPIYQSDLEFYDKISPSFNGVKYSIPTPSLCPEERQRRRLLFRNERKLYKRKCDASGKDIISMYAPNAPYKVFDQKFRRSDSRDAMDYGRDFDFFQSFTQQYQSLERAVPKAAVWTQEGTIENCPYINCAWRAKNSYMAIDVGEIEDCFWSSKIYHSHDLLDCFNLDKANHCFETISGENLGHCFWCTQINDCSYCYCTEQSTGCTHCLACIGLTNQSYMILNKQVSKEEFSSTIDRFLHDAAFREEIRSSFITLKQHYCYQACNNHMSENCIGNELRESKDCTFCFDMKQGEDCRYIYGNDFNFKDVMDVTIGTDVSLAYNCISIGGNHLLCCIVAGMCNDCMYCNFCRECTHCFGCSGLRNKQYCILNKQYTREEYEKLVPQIIAHMQATGERGEFFAPCLSAFGYNETVAHEYFPMTRNQASERGYKWQDNSYEPSIPEGADAIDWRRLDLPADITTVDDDILKKIFICEVSGRPFRIIRQELEFYRKHSLPLPRKHPDLRHEERIHLRPARALSMRTCDTCKKEIISVYPDQQQRVCCEACYNKKIYG